MRLCTCGVALSPERLKAQPDATLCTKCLEAKGDVKRVKGFMHWEHKTAPQIVIGRDAEELLRFDRKTLSAHTAGAASRKPSGTFSYPKDTRTVASVHNVLMSRCHPSRPRVGPSGLCAECASDWYKVRLR